MCTCVSASDTGLPAESSTVKVTVTLPALGGSGSLLTVTCMPSSPPGVAVGGLLVSQAASATAMTNRKSMARVRCVPVDLMGSATPQTYSCGADPDLTA